ncbi:MAG TPA: hypothetical protein VM935_06400 [Chitinophagaceae bacterium]|nr:hypothetical protein [Chitinophagaceae bacterium]
MEEGHDKKQIYFVKVKFRFNCKLYNVRTREMRELKDGEGVTFLKGNNCIHTLEDLHQ